MSSAQDKEAYQVAQSRVELDEATADAVDAQIDIGELIRLEQGAVRIPSLTYEEQECARYFAAQMERLGLQDVELMQVPDPLDSRRTSLQPIGWLRGTGGGPSMMLNGHMDHVPVVGEWERDPFSGDYEDGFIYGRGAQDDKGGIVAAIVGTVAIKRSGIHLRGDVMVCPVMAHKAGAVGTQALLDRGYRPTYCINTENSGIGIARLAVGVVRFLLHAKAKPTHFHSPADVRARFMNPFEQLTILMGRMGTALTRIQPGSWLTFRPDPELPDYPQLNYDDVHGGYMRTNRATLDAQIRLVPGQSLESVKADLERLIARLRGEFPNFDVEVEIPPRSGEFAPFYWPPFSTPENAPLVRSLARWHTNAAGTPPVVGAQPRLGAVGDGNTMAAAGAQVVEYGPGSVEEFAQWPTPNERISVREMVIAAKAMALTTVELCR